jgi:GNAT superfamily N-acetyltransferase
MPIIQTKLPDYSLRRGTPDDAALLLRFMRKLGAFQKIQDQITATEASLQRLLTSGQGEAVFAQHSGRPVGFVYFNETSSAFTGRSGLFIDAILVEAAHRQSGLGKVMMQFMAQEVMRRGGQMLEWACMDWNAAAIGFYQGLGAYCLDEMHVYRISPDDLAQQATLF